MKHPPLCKRTVMLFALGSNLKLYAGNFPGFQHASADVYTFRLAVHQNPHFLNIHAPFAAVAVVRVRNVVAGSGFFTGNITFSSHSKHRPSVANIELSIAYAFENRQCPLLDKAGRFGQIHRFFYFVHIFLASCAFISYVCYSKMRSNHNVA